MTVITKAGQEKKENELNKSKAKANEAFGPDGQALLQGGDARVEGQPPLVPSAAWNDEAQRTMDWYVAWRRRRLLSSLCAGLLVLWLLLASVVGGVLLFRYLHRRPVFYGWCGTQYREGRLGASRLEKLQERVQVDPDQELEKIEVPKFGPNRPAVFVHDFKQNVTAIVDVLGRQCFLKRLDREHVAPPESFIDLISKMESGYYDQDTAVVREHYSPVFPPLSPEELEEEGSPMIAEQCRGSLTFRLERDFSELLGRPQVDDPSAAEDPFAPENQKGRMRRSLPNAAKNSYRYFSGHKVVIYDIN